MVLFVYAAYSRQLREELHRIPEIGFDLPKTLAVVHRELDAMGRKFDWILHWDEIKRKH